MSLYSVLGVSPGATKDEIRVAYKRQALAAHPDKGGCAEAFHAVTRAFETLYDAAARARYDSRLARARRPAGVQPESGRSKGSDQAAQGRRPTCSAARTAARGAAATATASKQAPPCPQSAAGARPGGKQPSGEGPATAGGSGAAGRSHGPPPGALVPARGRRARRESRPWSACGGSVKERCAEICERLRELLQRLSPAARRGALEERFSQAQRCMLEQWMRTKSSAPAATPQGTDASAGTRASTALVAVPSSRDSCCSSCSSCTESSEEALALEHLDHDEVQVAHDEPRSSDEESVEAELEEEQEERQDEEEAATGHDAASEEGRIRYLNRTGTEGGRERGYSSGISADGLIFRTKYTRDLATALDFVVALMAIRECVPPAEVRESSIKPVILEVLKEHGLDAARDLGLKVRLSLPSPIFFVGRKQLRTPFVPFDRIGDVMSAWRLTAGRFPAMYNLGRASRRGGPKVTFFHVHDPVTAADMWSGIRRSYMESWAAAGRDARHVADWLDAQYAAHRAHRERQLETWNMLRMASEDPHSSLRAERRWQRQECRAMASEDRRRRLRRMRRTPEQIADELDSRLQRRVSQLLRRLGQVERQEAAARAKESRQEAAAKRGRCREEALERAAQRARREERWRWMNRRDITIGEMLREPAQA